jgi:hypothetical protein
MRPGAARDRPELEGRLVLFGRDGRVSDLGVGRQQPERRGDRLICPHRHGARTRRRTRSCPARELRAARRRRCQHDRCCRWIARRADRPARDRAGTAAHRPGARPVLGHRQRVGVGCDHVRGAGVLGRPGLVGGRDLTDVATRRGRGDRVRHGTRDPGCRSAPSCTRSYAASGTSASPAGQRPKSPGSGPALIPASNRRSPLAPRGSRAPRAATESPRRRA